jgi:hypothetical protein
MNEVDELWEQRLGEIAADFAYPPTPDIAARVSRRLVGASRMRGRGDMREHMRTRRRVRWRVRPAWVIAVLAFLLVGLLAVPPVRAQILDFLQIGVVRIFLAQPTPTPTPTLTPGPSPAPVTQTPVPPTSTPTLLPSLLDLAGQTTLEEAKKQAGFPVLLPGYPADIGPPDAVFLQDLGGKVLVMVWLQPGHPDQVRFSLHEYGPNVAFVEKMQPKVIEETHVHAAQAFWTTGPYLLKTRSGDLETRRLIEGHVLIWTVGNVTYRLETGGPLAEAVRIAESLR